MVSNITLLFLGYLVFAIIGHIKMLIRNNYLIKIFQIETDRNALSITLPKWHGHNTT